MKMSETKIQLENIREKLLDLGLRGNSLLHFSPRGKKHIDIVDEKSDEIFRLLVREVKKMTFLPSPEIYDSEEDLENSEIDLPSLEEYLIEEKGEGRFSDLHLQTKLNPNDLDLRLLKIENESKTIFQESGIDVLFIALGFLKWYEDDNSKIERIAPLVLIPVELNRTAAGKGFKVNYTELDLSENETLYAKIKNDFKIDLPRSIAENQSDLDIKEYFESIAAATYKLKRFEVVQNKIALGFFSFGKFQMYKDLDVTQWPDEAQPFDNDILKSLFETGFGSSNDAMDLDLSAQILSPEKLNLVKDADSTQTEAILKVMHGHSLVIQGPPGTGKSQTITNLISEAISRDKKVLFVAQKLTALEVVKNRLDQTQIGHSVLELHSHKSRPKDVLNSIRATLFEDQPEIPGRDLEKGELEKIKTYLDEYANLLKETINDTGFNFGQALGNYIFLKKSLSDFSEVVDVDFEFFRTFTQSNWRSFENDLSLIFEKLSEEGSLGAHPYYGAKLLEVNPRLIEALSQSNVRLLALFERRKRLLAEVSEFADLKISENDGEFLRLINSLKYISESKVVEMMAIESPILLNNTFLRNVTDIISKLIGLKTIVEELFDKELLTSSSIADAGFTKKSLELYGGKWYSLLNSKFRKAKASYTMLRKGAEKFDVSLAICQLNDLIEYLRISTEVAEFENELKPLFPQQWRGIKSDWTSIEKALQFVIVINDKLDKNEVDERIWASISSPSSNREKAGNYFKELNSIESSISETRNEISKILSYEPTNQMIEDSSDFESQFHILLSRSEAPNSLYYLSQVNRLVDSLGKFNAEHLGKFIYHFKGKYPKLHNYIKFSFWKLLLDDFYNQHDLIKNFDRTTHERFIKDFNKRDKETFNHAQEYLVDFIHKKLPSSSAPGEMTLLRREMAKKRRLLPVRRILEKASVVIQAIKPVFMMSPMSVATFLPPGKFQFDLVIFDEASQVPIPDSIGAILRGKQVIVVGDSKQMPPSSFFSKSIEVSDEDIEENFTSEIESVLDLFSAQGARETMLKWHYRSKHESLIYTSNKEFYDSKLFVFPSSGMFSDATGLKFIYTSDSIYERSGSRTNKIEAKLVADYVKGHVEKYPKLSLGVVAFSMAQKEAILFEVEVMRRNNPSIEYFFNQEDSDEPFFVKNLENVQGDERDVILISVGYGKTESGNLSRNFGPINNPGGERRLNVLMSRAKQQMIVFCNFKSDELRTEASSPFGVRVLKGFLKYAEIGKSDIPMESDKAADSLFEIEVANRIKQLGYIVEHQVGSQGFYIDIAIRHPKKEGAYLLAVECDGASYHSSANARDRDRLRQDILESIGWKFHRIWSTDWFRDETSEVERLRNRIEEVLNSIHLKIEQPKNEIKPTIVRIEKEIIPKAHHEYSVTNLLDSYNWIRFSSFDEIPKIELREAILNVVKHEGPVHKSLLINRLLKPVYLTRAGGLIKRTVDSALSNMVFYNAINTDGEIIYLKDQEVVVRDRANLPNSERKFEFIPSIEVEKCILEVVADALSIDTSELYREVSSRFGISRTTEQIKLELDNSLQTLIKKGLIQLEENKVAGV